MGLSSKQVSSRGLDWNKTLLEAQNIELPKALPMRKQQQQESQSQQIEAVKCPRCDSSNTKFCYYNNYNKSQPRHFCRACKRHWTKGGTLRNVPVGGGRKNKRLKKSTSVSTPTISSNTTPSNDAELSANMTIQKTVPSSLYQTIIHQPSMLPSQNLMTTRDSEGKDFGIGNGIFLSSSMSFPQNQTHLFPFSNSTSFDTNTCGVSTSLRSSSNVYNCGEELKTMEESAMNSCVATTSGGTTTQPWEMPTTSIGMEMSNYWSWEDIDSLVSTDLNASWDDSHIKP